MSGMGGGYGGGWDDPDQFEIQQLQQKQQLAQQMLAGMKPTGSRASGLMGILGAFLAAKQMKDANEGMQAVGDRMNQRRQTDMSTMADFLSMKPKAGVAPQMPLTPNDDEGNAMPMSPGVPGETPEAFQERKAALARTMIGSRNPQLQQLGMQALMPRDTSAFYGKLDPKDFTPESQVKFAQTGRHSDLVPRDKMEITPSGVPVNPYAMDPNKNYGAIRDVNMGGTQMFMNPGGGVVGNLPRTQSPESIASNSVTMRGQNMVNDRAKEANNIASTGNVIKTETDLRKEFADLPEVKNLKMAVPAFEAIKSAATRDTPQSDINIIYGLAKLYDPTSVVREGEYATIANSQAIPDWLKGQAQRIAGGGKLTAETKRQILQEAGGRAKVYRDEYERAKGTYAEIATQRGADPRNIFTPVGGGGSRAPVSQADLEATARKYGITVDQVKKQLGIP